MSTNSYYDIYQQQCIQLAQTIVIKSSETADLMNQLLMMLYGVDSVNLGDPTTWKYHMNLAGMYHPTDTMMTVVSMDTLETINFTVANLKYHSATARGYQYGTRAYLELVSRYPTQETLIKGILYPVNLATAVTSKDGQILTYPAVLIEKQERTLVQKLQEWIYNFKRVHYNPQYATTDNLYCATMLGIMYQQMVPAILNFRLEVCKTIEAHSYHIRQYLASHNALDDYMSDLTLRQQLWFYRNMKYIQRHCGKYSMFESLVEHTMTERNIPLASYTMRHDITGQPNSLTPEIMFDMAAVNIATTASVPQNLTLQQLLDKEQNVAPDNIMVQPYELSTIHSQMTNSLSNVVATKTLESTMIDYTDATPYTMDDILLNHWLFWSSHGVYNTFVNIQDPVTGDKIPLSAKDAFCFMWYAFCGSIGIKLHDVPDLVAWRVQRRPIPNEDDLLSVVNQAYVTRETATQALAMQPAIYPIISTQTFYETCRQIYDAAQMQRRLIGAQEKHKARGFVQNMVNRIYADVVCEVGSEVATYAEWFRQRNILIDNFTRSTLELAYQSTYSVATGKNLNTTKSIVNLQRSMVALMTKLSSYSVQYTSTINDSRLIMIDRPMVRAGDVHQQGSIRVEADVVDGTVTFGSNGEHRLSLAADWPRVYDMKGRAGHHLRLNRTVTVFKHGKLNNSIIKIPSARVRVSYQNSQELNNRDIIPMLGIEKYLTLSTTDQQKFKDVAGNWWIPDSTT